MPRKKINLGDEIEDVTAKISGIAVARIEYLDGEISWFIQPYSLDGRTLLQRIEIQDAYARKVGNGVHPAPKKRIGFSAREDV